MKVEPPRVLWGSSRNWHPKLVQIWFLIHDDPSSCPVHAKHLLWFALYLLNIGKSDVVKPVVPMRIRVSCTKGVVLHRGQWSRVRPSSWPTVSTHCRRRHWRPRCAQILRRGYPNWGWSAYGSGTRGTFLLSAEKSRKGLVPELRQILPKFLECTTTDSSYV